MLLQAVKKLIGSDNDRELKKIIPLVQQINHREAKYRAMSDASLQAQTGELKGRLEKGASLDDILVDAFAVCREASSRVLGMRHFDVQLVGGMALHKGMIAEMKTGEGKTLVSTLASYLNALSGKGTHIITVNDYLAKRDSEWMGRIHRFLGLEVGCILNHMGDSERKKIYRADITYGTNNEFGFDYLRDNMKPSLDMYVQRDPNFAIIDEVDSILIDEARTPLIISGPSDHKAEFYQLADKAVRQLKKDIDFVVDEKARNATLSEEGIHKLEQFLKVENLYAPDNLMLVHHVGAALRAHSLFRKDIDYVARNNEIMIVDEFTGRLMPGRRWSDGLHQAVECKEGVDIQAENQTLATITLQNYFRLYNKLSGMTGTAATEATEFGKIYGLRVLVIPTNRPNIRKDDNDLVYRNEAGKYRAVIEDIKEKYQAGRPVLVGTVSIAKSERISKLLSRVGIPHNVLNAKNHEREAEIIANAGQHAAVTIATNMAGRGTDIVLGPGVKDVGGLHVIGTERHESRRIDNQLRGRAGRQGDPGSSRFYLSLEDDLMRIFAGDRIVNIMDKLGMEEDVPISDRLITRTILNAQSKVEAHHFDQREHLLKYDDVLNKQREVIYSMRRLVLEGRETRTLVEDLSGELATDVVSQFTSKENQDSWDWSGLRDAVRTTFAYDLGENPRDFFEKNLKSGFTPAEMQALLVSTAKKSYADKVAATGDERMADIERYFFIQSIDYHWKDHLLSLDHLKEGIHLRGYAQKDPLVEYRREGFELFKMLDKTIRQNALTRLYTFRLMSPEEEEARKREDMMRRRDLEQKMSFSGPEEADGEHVAASAPAGAPAGTQAPGEPAQPTREQQIATNPGLAAAMNFLKQREAATKGSPSGSPKK
jgi:preprotein translocase subunit SecA